MIFSASLSSSRLSSLPRLSFIRAPAACSASYPSSYLTSRGFSCLFSGVFLYSSLAFPRFSFLSILLSVFCSVSCPASCSFCLFSHVFIYSFLTFPRRFSLLAVRSSVCFLFCCQSFNSPCPSSRFSSRLFCFHLSPCSSSRVSPYLSTSSLFLFYFRIHLLPCLLFCRCYSYRSSFGPPSYVYACVQPRVHQCGLKSSLRAGKLKLQRRKIEQQQQR